MSLVANSKFTPPQASQASRSPSPEVAVGLLSKPTALPAGFKGVVRDAKAPQAPSPDASAGPASRARISPSNDAHPFDSVLAAVQGLGPHVTPTRAEAVLSGLLARYDGPARAFAKAVALDMVDESKSSGVQSSDFLAYDPLVEAVGHQLCALRAAHVEVVARCLARSFSKHACAADVAYGIGGRLLDTLLSHTDSRTRQWAAVLTGCRAGMLEGLCAGMPASRADSMKSLYLPIVLKALDALVTRMIEQHGGMVQRREALLRECARTGTLPDAAAPLVAVLPPTPSRRPVEAATPVRPRG